MFFLCNDPYTIEQTDEFFRGLLPIEQIVIKKTKNDIKHSVYNIPASFDIEVSSFYDKKHEKCACMYVWQFGLAGRVIYGRTWEEFEIFLERLKAVLDLSDSKRLFVYVHNLAYEFQFINKRLEWDTVFATKERKVVYAREKNGIEFRCSYILSGMSLENVGEHLTKYRVEKKVGDLDYNKIRHSMTPLTDKEIGYCVNDVLVVMAYIQEQIEMNDGKITKIPLTKTGYVRRYCREHCLYVNGDTTKQNKNYKRLIRGLMISGIEEYKLMKDVYAGGFTHGSNLKIFGEFENVRSWDFTSSYPAVMCSQTYPMSSGKYKAKVSTKEFNELIKYYHCMFRCRIYNIREKVTFEHIISESKCPVCKNPVLDNGRIVSADLIETALTEIDLKNILSFYQFDKIEIFDLWYYKKAYLPKEFIECILHFYEEKTKLKDIPSEIVMYQFWKELLNSSYGMTVTDIVHELIEFNNGEWMGNEAFNALPLNERAEYIDKALNQYNYSDGRFLFYAWGVYITSYARNNLFSGILEFKEDYIYSDTDSVKVLNWQNHMDYINTYNSRIIKKIEKVLSFYKIDLSKARPVTVKGKEKPLGVWNFDGDYECFKTLGAKRYMVKIRPNLKRKKLKGIIYQGHIKNASEGLKTALLDHVGIHTTVAGLSKSKGSAYISKQNRPFDFFDTNMVIPAEHSGRITHLYIDEETGGLVTDYLGNTAPWHEYSSIHMEPSEYSLTMSDLFLKYLSSVIYVDGHI